MFQWRQIHLKIKIGKLCKRLFRKILPKFKFKIASRLKTRHGYKYFIIFPRIFIITNLIIVNIYESRIMGSFAVVAVFKDMFFLSGQKRSFYTSTVYSLFFLSSLYNFGAPCSNFKKGTIENIFPFFRVSKWASIPKL